MLIQVQVHPLRDDHALFTKLTEAMNKAAAEVLAGEGLEIDNDGSPAGEIVPDIFRMGEDETKVH